MRVTECDFYSLSSRLLSAWTAKQLRCSLARLRRGLDANIAFGVLLVLSYSYVLLSFSYDRGGDD
jgi:hypothetical protein